MRRSIYKEHNCLICGELYYSRKYKYCSNKCSIKAGGGIIYKGGNCDGRIKVVRICKDCGATFKRLNFNYHQRLCKKCAKTRRGLRERNRGIVKRAIIRTTTIEEFQSYEVFERDGWVCQICKRKTRIGAKVTSSLYPHLDHIIPLSKGGEHTKTNTQCLCRRCNMRKSDSLKNIQLRLYG